jgi:hypothetical protein
MSVNLLEIVCERLGYPALQKIDPNTQDVPTDKQTSARQHFGQAAIPAILTGLYHYVQTDEGANYFLRENKSPDWVERIFGDKKGEVVQKITGYSQEAGKDPTEEMNLIAAGAVKVAKENLTATADIKDVKVFFSNQINHILLYLPAELQVGKSLQEGTLDDKTNKMEGPMSSLVQNLGNVFSGPVTDKEVDNKDRF